MYVCMYVYMYVCMYVFIYLFMHVCMCSVIQHFVHRVYSWISYDPQNKQLVFLKTLLTNTYTHNKATVKVLY
jgi:hypothetical protein